MRRRRDFFVSYTEKDRDSAEWIAWQLEDAGYSVLIRAWDFVAGSNWLTLMDEAITSAEHTIAVLSPAYLNESPFGQSEWQAAYRHDPSGRAGRLIPVRVENCNVEGLLAGVVYADLFGLSDKSAARQRLLQTVRAALSRRDKPSVEPDFPERLGAGHLGSGHQAPHVPAYAPLAQSAYLAQVSQIAPRELLDRDAELAELAAFCEDPDAGPYAWWRASAWTGKSALMSTFVLHPPAGIRVVAFFITARFAGNSDRAAFVEVVTEQLATLLGQPMPQFQTEAAREPRFLHMLNLASRQCQANGERLVLVVDGLDEDRGVTVGPDARSIAALLPSDTSAGLRVIVAGRPDPPIPTDVPPDHPLRVPGIVRALTRSRHAAVIKASMQGELDRLRGGSPLERDLLGILTAAGGGLSTRDLAELRRITGHDAGEWEVNRLLSTVAGRSFTTRDARWHTERVYVLGHEDLQQDASDSYGAEALAGYRRRLHAWADRYRAEGWPAGTPEYLLRGYYRLLLADGDLIRAVDCATDLARHDRMLDFSVGDTAALTEITDAQNAILATPEPDLELMARLAFHRGHITGRNSHLPTLLPSVWVLLGYPDRAEQLARAIPDLPVQASALAGLATALVAVGSSGRARSIAAEAEQVVRAVGHQQSQEETLTELVRAFVRAGDTGRAQGAARAVTGQAARAWALTTLIAELVRAEEWELVGRSVGEARQAAGSIPNRAARSLALARLASVVAGRAGQHHEVRNAEPGTPKPADQETPSAAFAARVAFMAEVFESDRTGTEVSKAEQSTRAIRQLDVRAQALTELAAALEQVGEHDRACRAANDAEQAARAIPGSAAARRTGQLGLAAALIEVGDFREAERRIREIPDVADRLQLLTGLAAALAEAGDTSLLPGVASDGLQAARLIADPGPRSESLGRLAETLASTTERDRARAAIDEAEQIARRIDGVHTRAEVLTGLVATLLRICGHERATVVAQEAVEAALQIIHSPAGAATLTRLTAELVRCGDVDSAELVVRAIPDPVVRTKAIGAAAESLNRPDLRDRIKAMAAEAEHVARDYGHLVTRAEALIALTETLVVCNEQDRAFAVAIDAEDAARSITDRSERAVALAHLSGVLVAIGEYGQAERVARANPDPDARARALAELALGLVLVGGYGYAEWAVRAIPDLVARSEGMTGLVVALAQAGEYQRAQAAAEDAEQVARTIRDLEAQESALANLAVKLAQIGQYDRAEEIARAIRNPSTQARTLTAVAGRMAQAGQPRHARELVALALSMGQWSDLPLDSLAAVAPEALARLF